METPNHMVQCQNYSSDHRFIDSDLVHFKRRHTRDCPRIETDVFSTLGGLGIGHFQSGEVAAHRKQLLYFEGLVAFYIPPFSIIEWHLGPSELQWDGYLFNMPQAPSLPDEAIAIQLSKLPKFSGVNDLIKFITSQDLKSCQLIGKLDQPSSLAQRTKSLIDQSYLNINRMSISEICQTIGHSNSFISQKFKKAYGLSPVAYRNKLRVFEAIRLMMFEGKNVTTSGFESGFSDLSRFNKQFAKSFSITPSKYRLPTAK